MNKSIFLQVGVKIFLRNKNWKYLLLKRSPKRYPELKNNWDIPGGRIIPGISLVENLKREVFEETRLKILGEPRLIGAQDIIRGAEKHIVRLTFLGEISGEPAQVLQGKICSGEPILNDEHTEFRWFTLGEMLKIKKLDEFTREVLEKDFTQYVSDET